MPDWMLERYRLGELTEAERRGVEAQLDEADHARLAELDADDAAILKRYPPRVMAADLQERVQRRRRRAWAPVVGGGLALAAVAAAALMVINLPPDDGGTSLFGIDVGNGHRLKGDAHLVVHRQTSDGDDILAPNGPASAGDVLQLEVAPGDESYLVVVSIDGNGSVTRHLPLDGDQAVQVDPGRTIALPNAYTLDDAPRFERFFLVADDAPFGVQPILAAATRVAGSADPTTAELALSADLTVSDHLVRKESR